MARTVTILHTNDFHNHLTPELGEIIRAQRDDAGPNTLLLDAGDAVSAGNVGVRLGGEPILELMSDLGYAAMTLGNREFHVADTALRHKIGKARFPILSANMRYKDDKGEALPTVPHIVTTLPNGVRVGIFGVTVPMVTERMAARHLSAYVFDDPIAAAKREVAALRDDVDLLVAMTHIGYKQDQRLAAACPEIDVLIGGHSHVVIENPEMVGGVAVVQAGSFARYLGRIVLTDGDGGRWIVTEGVLLRLKPPVGD